MTDGALLKNVTDAYVPLLSPERYGFNQLPEIFLLCIILVTVYTFLLWDVLQRVLFWLVPRVEITWKRFRTGRVCWLAGVYMMLRGMFQPGYPPPSRRDVVELAVVEFINGTPPTGVPGLAEVLHEHADDYRPVLVRGGVAHWGAVQKWTPHYLLQHLRAAKPVVLSENRQYVVEEVVESIDDYFGRFVRSLYKYPNRVAVECYRNVTGHGPFYIAEADNFLDGVDQLDEYDAPWADEVLGFPDKVPDPSTESWGLISMIITWLRKASDYEYRASFWFGGVGVRTHWHLDTFDNFNVLVHLRGVKNVTLAHISDDGFYPQLDTYSYLATFSQVDRWTPDFERFPKYKSSKIQSMVLHPGDVLLIPQGWWHSAEALTHASISLSVRYYWCFDFWFFGRAWQDILSLLHHRGLYMAGRSQYHARRYNSSNPVASKIPALRHQACRTNENWTELATDMVNFKVRKSHGWRRGTSQPLRIVS